MKHLILLTALLSTETAFAVCASPISRTNVGANNVLTSTKYNTDVNTVYNKVNNLPGDCISDASLNGGKIIDGTVGTTKLTDGAVTTAKVADGAITAAKLAAAIENLVPVGTILPYGGATAPSGYIICDGQSLSRTTYAALYTAIGTAFGSVDGNSFNVPDLRGRFLRMVDGTAGRDPDKAGRTAMATGGNTGDAIGSIQGHMYASHGHGIDQHGVTASGITADGGSSWRAWLSSVTNYDITSHASGGNETRPVNANVNYIIKY